LGDGAADADSVLCADAPSAKGDKKESEKTEHDMKID
jgi:hypothetical protein